MDEVMGGHVLELESIKILRQGREEGDAKRLLSSVAGVIEKFGVSLEDACDAVNVTVEQYEAAKELVGDTNKL